MGENADVQKRKAQSFTFNRLLGRSPYGDRPRLDKRLYLGLPPQVQKVRKKVENNHPTQRVLMDCLNEMISCGFSSLFVISNRIIPFGQSQQTIESS